MSGAGSPPARCDLTVVGGGILGLAVARELTRRRPRASVCVLEREERLAAHQSSHNSGVLHAGIYYAPGSLKARLCVQGARELHAYCEEQSIACEPCGKVIVATHAGELSGLDELERRGRANGVADLTRLDAHALRALEPHCVGIAALHSPHTALVDFAAVARAYARDVRERGGTIATGCEVLSIATRARSVRLEHARGVTDATHAIFCAGAWSDRLAVLAGARADPRIVPFRGAYLRLTPAARALVRALIYPVPDPALPFLGVHLTRHPSAGVLIGPTALPVAARDGYRLASVRARDALETLTWPGSWRLARRYARVGANELHHALFPASLLRAAARYVPELHPGDAQPAFAGIRAQALARDGTLVDDFVFDVTERALHVRNAPSPGATASLAIARHIVDRASESFGW